MKKVLRATCALRDRYIVSIERVYTPSTFYVKSAVYVYLGDNWNGIMKDTLREECDASEDCLRDTNKNGIHYFGHPPPL